MLYANMLHMVLFATTCHPSCRSDINRASFLLSVPQNLSVCPEDESIIMSSFVNTMTSLSVKQGEGFALDAIGFVQIGTIGINRERQPVFLPPPPMFVLQWRTERCLTSEA